MLVWTQFGLCLVVIAAAGYQVCRYADVIAEKAGLTGSWVGIVLLATVTSLPELSTGITSVTVARVPDIAVGDALGSCVFNLLIIGVLDSLQRGESIYTRATQGHILAATLGVVMIGFAGFNILLARPVGAWHIGHVGVASPIIVALYVLAIRMIHRYEIEQLASLTHKAVSRYQGISLRQAIAGYGLSAAVVVSAGVLLPFAAARVAELMGWGQSFVGTLLVAAATSAPEMAVTISAFRIGAINMAIAGLLGSNLFDVLILAVDDLFYRPGPLLASVSRAHVLSAFTAIMMSGVAVIGLFLRARARPFLTVGWTSLALFTLYLLNSYVLYLHAE
jgi:cation:H+ antiporter